MSALHFQFMPEKRPDIEGIMLAAFATLETPAESRHRGAFDHSTKPVRIDKLKASAEPALRTLEAHQEEDDNDRRD